MQQVAILLTVVLALGSCKKEADPPKTPSPTPEAETKTGEAVVADAESRKQRVERAIARVPDIQKGVAKLRGLEFKAKVPAEHQSTEDFEAFLGREIAKELPPAKNTALGKALFHIGMLPNTIDLAETLKSAFASQAGAYYDPAQKKFFVLMVPEQDILLDTMTSHELHHALQDQHFDLGHYYLGHDDPNQPTLLNEDELHARQFIVEGEATLIMTAYTVYSLTQKNMLKGDMVGALRPQIEAMANMSIESLRAASKSQASGLAELGEDMKKAVEAMDSIPLAILLPLLESYTKGVLPVYIAFSHGGWDAVSELFTDPPQSTEQVLHPAEKLIPKRDYPVAVTIETPKGWDKVHSDVLGELGWRVYFKVWGIEGGDMAAAGWDGDRWTVYKRQDAYVGLLSTTWDSPAEAGEFEAAYLASLAKRFPGAAVTDEGGNKVVPRPDGTKVYVNRVGPDVYILDGGSDATLLGLAKTAIRTRHPSDKAVKNAN